MRRIETKRRWFLCNLSLLLAAVVVAFSIVAGNSSHSFVTAQQGNADLTGNWKVQTPPGLVRTAASAGGSTR